MIFNEIATHLKDGEVAIFLEVGHEGLRYLAGNAITVHSSGKIVTHRLSDIYAKVRDTFGTDARTAEY